jgi:hypothetical protein
MLWEQGVVGSNPATPTKQEEHLQFANVPLVFRLKGQLTNRVQPPLKI